ncbi:keratin, type I cytoskeletal 19-like [Electrophorus electricus]|uniref:keratin, type I cytoskeletal 19-like n=1 Tax=Electrophorus electricus TaxID=8005 RepID=UPI0015D0CBF4|nr:keratin, type I cytoskeletal 19-like [Electrophorus electricus]
MLLSSFPDRQAYLRPSAISETAESQVGKHIIKSRSKHPAMLPHHYSSYASSGTVRLKALSSSSVSLSYGGYGTRMSHSSAKVDTTHDFIFDNEKMILQNLNRRMAAYLDKVRSLEAANRRIELQIKEWYERRSTTYCKDLTHYYSTTEELCEQINSHAKENALLFLQVDHIKMATANFKARVAVERNMCLVVEAEMAQLRRALVTNQMACEDLKFQISSLEEQLVLLKKNHEEEMHLLRTQQCGSVDVQMDCATSVPLDEELQALRAQFEALIIKYQRDAKIWFQSKVKVSRVTSSTAEVKTSHTLVSDLKKTYQQRKMELDSLRLQNHVVGKSLAEVDVHYAAQQSKLQLHTNYLQGELEDLKASTQQQCTQYKLLLDVKMRLETEITEYRRLLGGEATGTIVNSIMTDTVTQTVETKKEVTAKKHAPHIQRRVKIIVEKLVDGEVVSVDKTEKLEEVIN